MPQTDGDARRIAQSCLPFAIGLILTGLIVTGRAAILRPAMPLHDPAMGKDHPHLAVATLNDPHIL